MNKIVIDYGDNPDLYLIGGICHKEYALAPQSWLNEYAVELGVKRPQSFSFDSVAEMLAGIEKLQGQEGLCVYTPDGQDIRKVKSAWYLALHRFKENANIETVLDLFVEYGYPSYNEFETKLTTQFDYECLQMVTPFMSRVVDAHKEVEAIKAGMVRFVEPLRSVSRKEAAGKIISAYGQTNRASFCFQLLDGKTLDSDANKKLFWQVLKA